MKCLNCKKEIVKNGRKGRGKNFCSRECFNLGSTIKTFKKGNIPTTKGKKRPPRSDAWKKKLSEANSGENNHFWLGGLSFEKYTIDWTRSLRISIRERDKYTCRICGEKQEDVAFDIHHIDYDKKNCNPSNLITLCRKCHMKTNHNREYWKEFLSTITF